MLRVLPNTEFGERLDELSEICRHQNEPIIFTHEGRGDLVVMGIDAYNQMLTKLRLLKDVAEANARLVENEVLTDEALVAQAVESANAKVQSHFRYRDVA